MRRGVTLLELLVVLVIVGVAAGISALALAGQRPTREASWVGAARRARADAIRTGRTVRLVIDSAPGSKSPILFLPDGRAIGVGLDPLTGEPSDAHR